MNIDVAKQIVDAAEHLGIEASLQEDYSGRGMFGDKTAAITIGSVPELLAAVVQAAIDSIDADAIRKAVRKARLDSMGHDIIVY